MNAFLKSLLFFLLILFLLKPEFVYSIDLPNQSDTNSEKVNATEKSIFKNKRTISEQTISEIKKSQILLLIVITFFVSGFLFLIYHLKKVRIINQQLENYSREKEFLISETNHRVNNNLQLISFLISNTIRKKQNQENTKDFIRLQSKVDSIALLHRHLYQSNNTNKINLKNYLTEVKNNFYAIELDKQLNLNFEIEEIEIQSDNAMYIGLLVTELIINSVKYSFEDSQEKLIWTKVINNEKSLFFEYKDNGKKSINKTIQPKLVSQLCQQLKVNYKIETSKGFNLSFNQKL